MRSGSPMSILDLGHLIEEGSRRGQAPSESSACEAVTSLTSLNCGEDARFDMIVDIVAVWTALEINAMKESCVELDRVFCLRFRIEVPVEIGR